LYVQKRSASIKKKKWKEITWWGCKWNTNHAICKLIFTGYMQGGDNIDQLFVFLTNIFWDTCATAMGSHTNRVFQQFMWYNIKYLNMDLKDIIIDGSKSVINIISCPLLLVFRSTYLVSRITYHVSHITYHESRISGGFQCGRCSNIT